METQATTKYTKRKLMSFHVCPSSSEQAPESSAGVQALEEKVKEKTSRDGSAHNADLSDVRRELPGCATAAEETNDEKRVSHGRGKKNGRRFVVQHFTQ
ncbi:UNVERIFIED_CONTAM: hypothetical protein HHA_453620 [Hammondia hammondi]|eukprot:XP_008886885.1 hypothetical protein HHA_453620 [Hammondia hammondi]